MNYALCVSLQVGEHILVRWEVELMATRIVLI